MSLPFRQQNTHHEETAENSMSEQATTNAPDPADVGSRIDPVLARSWLLVNGGQADRVQAAAHSRADIVVLDIEDAVAPRDKEGARDNVVAWLGAGNSDWVRVNGFGTRWWADDLKTLAGTSIGGVMLAMVESVDDVTETDKRLPNVPIVALVETARGLERITEIAAATGTFRLAFGIGDFRMTGEICLHPDHGSVVNEGLSPSQDEIAWAKELFAEFERDGGEIRNGSDLPRIARATKILELARSYGIEVSHFDDEPVHMPAPSDTYHY